MRTVPAAVLTLAMVLAAAWAVLRGWEWWRSPWTGSGV